MSTPNAIYDFIKDKAMAALRGKTGIDKFMKMWEAEENKTALEDFVLEPDCRLLYIYQSNDKIVTANQVPPSLEKQAIFFIKSTKITAQLTIEDFQEKVTSSQISGQAMLDSLSLTAGEVYFPLLSNPSNRQGWSGPTSKEVMLKLSNFLSNVTMTVGQYKGQTLLPYPPPEAFDEDNLPEQEREYLLETSVVQWTKKIEAVLNTDPDQAIKQGLNPDGLVEIEFWKAKSVDLKSLHAQLVSDKMNAVLDTLKQMNSPFGAQFETVTEKVAVAEAKATSNRDYLLTLEKYFIRLDAEMEFSSLDNVFFPMMHTIMLIWTHAPYYKEKARMNTLMQEICNAIVKKGSSVVSGKTIFRLIEDENAPEARAMLAAAINTCNVFKNAVARYRHKAKSAFSDDAEKLDAWDMNPEVVFCRLDLFLERCQDISEFLKMYQEFNKLEKICLGGTKGAELSEDIAGIHQDFVVAVQKFQNVPYDCMDITVARFDTDFYQYRVDIKELERRLATVIIDAFDDAASLKAIFKLLDGFGDGLIERPIIQDEINKKHPLLLSMYMEDLNKVQAIFATNKDSPRIDNNMPPIAGALSWSRGLLDRINEPIGKLRKLTAGSEREQAKEVEKVHEAICTKLSEYENAKIVEWAEEVDQSSQSKLMQALVRRDKESRRLSVNFDDDLVRLLREVKYFLLLGLEVPRNALTIYEKGETYRTQIGNLDLISHMYNEMMETLHVVERPLVEKEMAHIDETIEKGISELNWNSPDVEDFIAESMTTVKAVYSTVKTMKENFKTIKKLMSDYAKIPLVDRKSKPLSPADFEENMRKLWVTRHQLISEHQETVAKLLAETNEALTVNKGSPIWRAYVEYVQDHVRDELALTIVNSIKFICDQLDQSNIEKNALAPLLEIKLVLYGNDVIFNAEEGVGPVDEKVPRKSRREVWNIVNDWVEGFFEIGNIMTRMDGSHYVGDMKKNEGIVRVINNLKKHLDWNQKECETFRQEFLKFDFLWKTDRTVEFNRFLAQAKKQEETSNGKSSQASPDNEAENEGGDDDEPADPNAKSGASLPLDKFEEKINYYRELQSEISEKKSPVEIGWLKINAQPIKVALGTWITRWIATYTSFLYNDVTRKLFDLDSLMNEVNEGLQQEVKKGDSDALKRVLGYIHVVRTNEKSTTKMFQPLRDTASLLKKFGKPLEEYELKLLSDAPMKWDTTVNNVYKVKEKINNLQNEEVDKIKDKVSNFDYLLIEFRKKFRKEAPFVYENSVNRAYSVINSFHKQIGQIEEEAAKLVDLERVFELSVSKHREIKKCRTENKLLKQCWDMVSIVRHLFESWKKTLWDKIDTDSLLMDCKKLQNQIKMMPKELRSWKVYQGMLAEVKNFATVLPLVNSLHSPCMEQRHWADLKKATGRSFEKTPSFCLSNLLDLELHLFVADVESIVELATKESKIEMQLNKIDKAWATLQLEFGVHAKKGGEVPIIRQPEEILTTLEENMTSLQGMQQQGRYVEYFIDRVSLWQKSLGNTETVLVTWLDVQRNWAALEAIFLGSQDIRVQLPEDSRRFDEIDANFRKLMSSAIKTPNVIEACAVEGRKEMLQGMETGLEMCEKSLFQYLETKRKAFPRFYFVANAALLDILSNGYNPQAIQKHIGDCFDGIAHLRYQKDAAENFTNIAVGMKSKVGDEYVPFHKEFEASGAVEDWLNKLVRWMRDSLKEILAKAKFTADHWELEAPRTVWVRDYPAQIALTVSQIIWTEEVGHQFEAFADGNEQAMKDYVKVLDQRLNSFIELVLGDLNKCDRDKIITLITVDVHNRDAVQKLIDEKVTEVTAFSWQAQLRFGWDTETQLARVMVADASFDYSYEYTGNTGRLVITPLTDRCYITLTQALRLIMGGAPAGPAGTGKTETVKDLSRGLGHPVYVFNGSEQMNVTSMSAVFKGLVQTGAWGCFDEFNRIPIEVLSVVSTQFGCILNGIRGNVKDLDFLGELIPLVRTIGCFITMNPGYAGRTELPENLKALFRSCAMVVPDIELICENMLMSEGFLGARRLAKKFTTLYGLSKELLSKQMHYDWGLRATKAVLRVAGGLKRAEPEVAEDRILLRALRDFNLPKLVDDDKPIFLQLISDLFPGLGNTQRKMDPQLHKDLCTTAQESGLQAEDMFISKCVELAELLVIRHSVFVIGPPGAAKSTCWKTLAGAFNKQGITTVFQTLNPKAIRNNELFGWLSKTDWNDGVLSTLMRNMSRENHPFNSKQKNKWIILDGDIDPEWIESLNTVMDDNKVLTLVSNERIPLTDSMRLIFEIANLDNATPATVSRAGILFINARDVGFKPFLDSWIEKRENDSEKSSLLSLFLKYTTPEFVSEMRTSFAHIIPVSEISMIKALCRLLEGLLDRMAEARKGRSRRDEKMDPATEKELFETNFVFACVWAFGGACIVDKTTDSRKEFSEWWKRVFPNVKFPKEGTVFDYFVHPDSGKFVLWDDVVTAYDPPDDAYLVTKVFVPISETVRLNFMMDLLVLRGYPLLIVGNAGTGKTVVVKKYLTELLHKNENFMQCTVNLNYYTDAKAIQVILEGPIDKRSGRTYGPPGTKKLIYFVDDLNMPFVDKYGTQSPSALIRQHMDYQSWYDTTKLEARIIKDVQFLACMNPTAGSFTVDPRLQGQFATFSSQIPSAASLKSIYNQVLSHHLTPFDKGIQAMCNVLVEATIDLHDAVSMKFLPSSRKFHYQFTLRDISAIFQGLCMCTPKKEFNTRTMTQLWLHECSRVFADRLINPEDEDELMKLLEMKAKKYFHDSLPSFEPVNKEVDAEIIPNIFTSFVSPEPMYVPVQSMTQLKAVTVDKLNQYNDSNPIMNLELFGMAVGHVARVCRIIENPNGNALLVGVGGSGKQSLARLSAFICSYDIFQIAVSSTYGVADLKADLQELYIKTGVKSFPVMFLLTDLQILDDTWLVFVNDLLSSGFIPALFADEDLDGIFSNIRNEAKAAGVQETRNAMMDYFISRVRSNLHMCLCMSPVGEIFRVRCRKFPALISCTSIDWFHPWPHEALVSVAYRFLGDLDDIEAHQSALSLHMAKVHLSVNEQSALYLAEERRYNYTTPKSFLELIDFYKSLLIAKRSNLQQQTSRLEKGITTIVATKKDVDLLQEDLQKTLVRVAEKTEATNELIDKMAVERKKVEEQQAISNVEAAKAKTVAEVANKISEECRRDLAAALPLMEKAKHAVDCLDKASLTTLKSFAQPPGNVVYVTNATMILLNVKAKLDWSGAKKMMKDIGQFLAQLKSFDATQISEDTVKKVKQMTDHSFFESSAMAKSSEAAANLCEWVLNIVAYNQIYKNVAPKIAAQEKAQAEYELASSTLKAAEDRVATMQVKLKQATDALKQATDEKNKVEAEAENCKSRLSLANRLVGGLASEGTRWGLAIDAFKAREATLIGDVMLAASFVSYVGAFNQKYRKILWANTWLPDMAEREIKTTEGVDPLTVLSNEADFAKWKNEGLSSDRISLENGAILTKCKRWPLMIDPQLQGVKWIRGRNADLKVINLGSKTWNRQMTTALSMGQTVLIESLGEDIDATLDPVMSRMISIRGHEKIIKLGAEEISYDDGFQLFLQTKLTNPHYKPEIAAQSTILNFIVTEEGLEDQLLAQVVNKEKPELEEQRTELVRSINNYMVSLTELENELLQKLSDAPDDILSDVALIEGLEKTKIASIDIQSNVESAKKAEITINITRNEYRSVAAEGSWLYFLLIQLCIIDHMYQFSLDAFQVFFHKAIDRATRCDNIKERVANLRQCIRVTVFTWASRGLFEKHKLIFGSQLTFKLIQKQALQEKVDPSHFDYLIRGPKKAGIDKTLEFLPLSTWQNLCALVKLEGFQKLIMDMEASPNRFKEWFSKARPEFSPLPLEWRKLDDTNPFMKMMVVRAMRMDRMTTAMSSYIETTLPDGKKFTECDAGQSFLDILEHSLKDSSTISPLFFILSSGTDPVASVVTIAKRMDMYEKRMARVALGQGQDIVANAALELAHKEGHWVILENIHLMPRWCRELEKKLDEFALAGSHPDFRLFLSAEPSAGIPIGLLERSIKLTNEPPQGLKQNLKKAFASFVKDDFEFRDPKVKSIMFGLCHFHSIILERIKFGPQGWNRPYPFNTGDLMNSATVLQNYLETSTDKVPWKDLRYIFGEILYGGHITDDLDRLLCNTYLEFYMREELLDEMELFPFNESFPEEKFQSPPVLPYDSYFEYIDSGIETESPVAFGLHPNAEIAVKTTEGDALFSAIIELQPRGGSSEGDVQSPVQLVQIVLEQIIERVKGISYNLDDIIAAVVDDRGPYQNVFIMECDRMNMLIREILRSLRELDLGLSGELQMSERMENLMNSIFLGKVPPSWEKLAYPSLLPLGAWVDNLIERAGQLSSWAEEPMNIPIITQLSYCFNPQSFLTAIMQVTAQRQKLELDKLVILTEVTRKTVEQTDSRSREGAYVSGLALEGAAWNVSAGVMVECNPRQMFDELPVTTCRAIMRDKMEKSGVYMCPVYKTQMRGPTFVFFAPLRTKLPSLKWILAGAAIVLEVARG